MEKYEPKKIEKKWQKYWEEKKIFEVKEKESGKKFYALVEFPYPSGAGLHVGHPRSYTAMDIIARQKRMQGYNILLPIGFDAFGLPTENYAIKTGRPPIEVTAENVKNFTRQLKMLGYSFDWSRAVNTTDPKYYKWTQWIFLQFFKHGLAYKAKVPINWCLDCKIGLANEEVVDGKCERCGGSVEKRDKEQWMLAITKYADKLLEGLKEVDYIPQAKIQQENWIGRKEGINIEYEVKGLNEKIVCFTTRPDTNFGATFIVVAPESKFVKEHLNSFSNRKGVNNYINEAGKKTDIERVAEGRKKTGVFTGLYAVNNLNGREMPIYVSDFVLADVGTGAVVGVPGHDLRDFEFAKAKGIEIIRVVVGPDSDASPITKPEQVQEEMGIMINSGFLDGMDIHKATQKVMNYIEEKGWGKRQVQYKLRDWVFSRQRYWGEPIPLVFCEKCKSKKQKILLVHGFTGRADKNWIPWMKRELEKIGFEVYAPTMTTTEHPVLDKWIDELMPIIKEFSEDDVIVGHSLGGKAVLHLLEKINKKIGHLYLVAPAIGQLTDEEWRQKKIKKPHKDYEAARVFSEAPLNWKKIKNKAGSAVVIYSNDDESVKSHGHELWPMGWDIKHLGNHGHFTGEKIDILFDVISRSRLDGWIPLPESELPLELPKVKKYEPADTGESPLATITDWVNTKCPKCGRPAKRETDTMPNWAGSSWYFLRYCDPHNKKEFASMEKLKYWTPVDWYNGGMEHTVLHLLYSRFWNQFLYDIGVVPTREPYKKRTIHGMILGEDGEKMSKSRGNVVNPDEIVEKFGADAFRMYIMFMGPFDQAVAWDTNGLVGVRRFLERVWLLFNHVDKNYMVGKRSSLMHKTIKKISEDIDEMKFNTAIAQLMIWVNELNNQLRVALDEMENLLLLLSPFAPHLCEELWNKLEGKKTIAYEPWPEPNLNSIIEVRRVFAVQVNGKLRDTFEAPVDISESDAKEKALASEKIQKWLAGQKPKKVIYVKGRLVNIVI